MPGSKTTPRLWWALARSSLLFLLLSPFCSAQDHSSSASSATVVIRGSVVNQVTGEPIPRAEVQFYGQDSGAQLTDDQGRFEFHGVHTGYARFVVRKPGYIEPQEVEGEQPYVEIGPGIVAGHMEIGPANGPITLKMIPEGVIFGHIQDDSGEPVERKGVRVLASHIDSGWRVWHEIFRTSTDPQGNFRIPDLPPGKYYLEALPSQFYRPAPSIGNNPAYVGNFGEYYPGVEDFHSASLIEIQPGALVQADFTVPIRPAYSISGKVISPIHAVRLSLEVLNDTVFGALRVDPATGEFHARLPAGTYRLAAESQPQGPDAPIYYGEITINLQSDQKDVELLLSPAVSIPVILHKQTTKTDSESADQDFIPVAMSLRSARNMRPEGYLTQFPRAENRAPNFSDVLPDRYYVEIDPIGGYYVLAAKSGETDLTRNPLIVTASSRPEPIEVTLRDDAAGLTCHLSNLDGQRGAGVLLINDDTKQIAVSTNIAKNREVQIPFLRPGNYSVVAIDGLAWLEYHNPEVIAPYLERAVHVTLQPETTTELTLDVVRRQRE